MTVFPYRLWESTAAATDNDPEGHRYRLVALRDDGASLFLLSVWIDVAGEPPLAVARYEVSPSAFEVSVAILLAAIERCHGVSFTSSDAPSDPLALPRLQ